jgi:2-polyprenyl-3-methyl-5-hydroxy-6-metoxy-1,4-benzoquinol methylase
MPAETGMNLRQLWSNIFGKRMTHRLVRLLLPDLVWNQEIYGSVVRRYVNEKTRWLDVGCGWRMLGEDLEPMEEDLVTSAGTVVGCDMDFHSLRKHRNIRKLVLGSAQALPFQERSFDLVTCNMVVEHLSDPGQSFDQMARMLSPGGRLIVHTPNLWNYAVFMNHTIARLVPRKFLLRLIKLADNRGEDDVFITFYRANTTRRLLETCGKMGFQEEFRRILIPPQPFFNFFAPLALLQILFMRLCMSSHYFRRFGSTILMVFKYSPAHTGSFGRALPADSGLQTTAV